MIGWIGTIIPIDLWTNYTFLRLLLFFLLLFLIKQKRNKYCSNSPALLHTFRHQLVTPVYISLILVKMLVAAEVVSKIRVVVQVPSIHFHIPHMLNLTSPTLIWINGGCCLETAWRYVMHRYCLDGKDEELSQRVHLESKLKRENVNYLKCEPLFYLRNRIKW